MSPSEETLEYYGSVQSCPLYTSHCALPACKLNQLTSPSEFFRIAGLVYLETSSQQQLPMQGH